MNQEGRSEKFLAVSEFCKAVFRTSPGLKVRMFDKPWTRQRREFKFCIRCTPLRDAGWGGVGWGVLGAVGVKQVLHNIDCLFSPSETKEKIDCIN